MISINKLNEMLYEAWELFKSAIHTHANSYEWKKAQEKVWQIYEYTNFVYSNLAIDNYLYYCALNNVEPKYINND